MADTKSERRVKGRAESAWQQGGFDFAECGDAHVADSDSDSAQGLESETQSSGDRRPDRLHSGEGSPRGGPDWPPEPGVGRVVDGMAYRVDRLKAIGNGQVSRVAAAAFHLLA